MTLKSLIQSQASTVFMKTDHFADATIKRYPLGDSGSPETLTAIFIEEEAKRDTSGGDENIRRGQLYVLESQTTDPEDQWLIDSEEWQTISIGGSEGGLKPLELQRTEEETTWNGGGKLR